MLVVLDLEANSLHNPSKIWCVVCKDIGTGLISIFRNLTEDEGEKERCLAYLGKAAKFIGHNFLEYDYPVLNRLCNFSLPDIASHSIDTLVVSKLVNYSRKAGHSIESYGEEFGLEKLKFTDFTKWSQELEDYCARDVDICERIYHKYRHIIDDPKWHPSISLEHQFQLIVNSLHDNGFAFDSKRATALLAGVTSELAELDEKILRAFPPKEKLIREFTPKLTKFGTISKTSVPRALWGNIAEYEAGQTYRHTRLEPFNPASHKQVIAVLNEAGWSPTDKTQTHIDTEREINRYTYQKNREAGLDLALKAAKIKIDQLRITGWKINENNLSSLPSRAPSPARLLAKRILLEARRRTLTEWLGLVHPDTGRIHGRFYGIGAWTHRMAHQQPNTANIPGEFNTETGAVKLLGKEMRTLWQAPPRRLLVGVDAEGIQLRIFAHYIDDTEFTDALVRGKKHDKTDPHSLNKRILGDVCNNRQAAKRFVYALLLGAGIDKLAQILAASRSETEDALGRLLERYKRFAYLKKHIIPADARRGWFLGLDGRRVPIPGEAPGERKHLCMSGYLQNGEAIIMKRACVLWHKQLLDKPYPWKFVNFVHDEWQTEAPNKVDTCLEIASIQADSLRIVGEELKLKCPLAGSYWNDDHKDYTIGKNWYQTH